MSKKCPCGNAAYCRIHSKYKLQFMIREEYKNSYRITVFRSFFKEEKKPAAAVKAEMLKRLEPVFRNAYNTVQFRDNATGQLIEL